MITIKSTAYKAEDVCFVADVIDRGLCGCCEKYSSYYNPHDIACEGCVNKIACSDLQSAYHYMLAKLLRMNEIKDLDVITSDDVEFPDS